MASEPDASGAALSAILGGRAGAVDAGIPAVAFVTTWAIAGAVRGSGTGAASSQAVLWGSGAAVLAGLVLAVVRLARGKRPAAVLLGLLGAMVAAFIVLRTGRAADFFLLQIASNAASALAWVTSIAVRWPLLGVVVGLALGQRSRWRADPDLLRGYSRASWVWAAQYLVRLAVLIPLYRADQVVALGVARALTWVPVVACVAVSWPVLRTALPDGHPGIRYPQTSAGEPRAITDHAARSTWHGPFRRHQ